MKLTFNILIGQWISQKGVNIPWLSRKANVPEATLKKWPRHNGRTPRYWTQIAKVARALELNQMEASELLISAGKPSISELKQSVKKADEIALLGYWRGPFLAPPKPGVVVGRDTTIMHVIDVLTQQNRTSIYMVQGMAGVGKTTIAMQVAHQIKDQFPDGVLWADVQEDTPERLNTILVQFARACALDIPSNLPAEVMNQQIRASLAEKRLLIVLDNVQTGEQIDAIRPVGELCSMLLTARPSEISLPFGAERVTLMPFDKETDASLILFQEYLGEQRVNDELDVFAEIADVVGHLPLAITIVAKRLEVDQEQRAIKFLEDELRPEHARLEALEYDNLSVRVSFNLSYQRLTVAKQRYFSDLGVFEGEPFTDEAAGHVLELSSRSVKAILRDLHHRGLVQKTQDGRYQLHLLLSQYAHDFLLGKKRYERKIRYYIDYAERYKYDEQMLFTELDNIRRALRNARDYQLDTEFVRGVIVTYRPFFDRGFYDIVNVYLSAALEIARRENEVQAAAQLLTGLSFVALRNGQQDEASRLLDEAKSLATGATTISVGLIEGQIAFGESAESALNVFRSALEQTKSSGEHQTNEQAILCYNIAQVYDSKGDLDQAEQYLTRCLSALSNANNPRLACLVNRSKGIIAQKRGQYQQSELAYKVALGLADKVNNLVDLITIYNVHGDILRLQGHYAAALDYYQLALEKSTHLSDPYHKIYLLVNIAVVFIERGNYLQANHQLQQAFKLDAQMERNRAKPLLLITQGKLLMRELEDIDGAKQMFLEGLALAESVEKFEEQLNAQIALGNLYLKLDDVDAAESYFTAATEHAERLQYVAEMWCGRFGLAQTAHKQGYREDSVELAKRCFDALEMMEHYQAKQIETWIQSHSLNNAG